MRYAAGAIADIEQQPGNRVRNRRTAAAQHLEAADIDAVHLEIVGKI